MHFNSSSCTQSQNINTNWVWHLSSFLPLLCLENSFHWISIYSMPSCALSSADSHFANNKPVTFLRALSDFLISVDQGTPYISHHAKLPQSCPTLCNSMDCSLPGSSGPWYSPGKNTGAACHFLLQGIFLTLGSNLCLLHVLAGGFFIISVTWEAISHYIL